MRVFFTLVVALFLLPGCIGSKRYARYVRTAYDVSNYNPSGTKLIDSIPGISVIYDGPSVPDSFARVRKGDHHVVPAVFYWQINEEFECEFNPQVLLKAFRQYVYENVDSLGLTQKLQGRRLVLTVHNIPRRFHYKYKDDMVFLLIAAVQVYQQSIFPDENDLVVSYAVYEGETVVKKGTVREYNHDVPVNSNNTTRKKITRKYVRQYHRNLMDMVTKCMLEVAGKV